jgi:CheY-like chemotaxis protein
MIEVETKVATMYSDAATAFSDDESFSNFLSQLAKEEEDHIKLLQESMASLSNENMDKACFYFDVDFRHKIEAPILRAQLLQERGELTKWEMIDVIADVEFSEWNEIFIYTMDTTKILNEDFQKAVSDVEKHRLQVQDYISNFPGGESLLQKVKRLRSGWNKRILIVENNLAIARMLEALTMLDAEVIIAKDGEEGISLVRKNHFDLIITDAEIPRINGIEMYKKAVTIDPKLRNRFIFFTGTENSEYLSFIETSNIKMLRKPSPVKLICNAINDVLEDSTLQKNATLH